MLEEKAAAVNPRTFAKPKAPLTMAPKLWPVSWAITCHSVRPPVETAVPDTDEFPLGLEVCWHLCRSE